MNAAEWLASRGLADLLVWWPQGKPVPQIDYESKQVVPTLINLMEAYAASETAAKEAAEAERDRAVRALQEASVVITNACQIIDVTKIEWAEAWSDWDQSVREAASEWLKGYYAARAEQSTETPPRNLKRYCPERGKKP